MGKISPVIEKEPNMPTFGEKLAETFKINPKLVSLKFLMLLLYGGKECNILMSSRKKNYGFLNVAQTSFFCVTGSPMAATPVKIVAIG